MEFNCDIIRTLPGRITILEFKDSNDKLSVYDLEARDSDNTDKHWICNLNPKIYSNADNKTKRENLENIIDQMGYASARAQDLLSPITTFVKLLNSNLQKVYIARDLEKPYSVIGILKVGRKRLFICDNLGAHYEIDATCILDFYVHESKQRQGFGHYLFNAMLKEEKIEPSKLAIDRPSHKLLAFLGKHYGLTNPIAQANNFVVYMDIFNDSKIFLKPPIFLYNQKELPNNSSWNTEQINSFDSHKTTPVSFSGDLKSFPYSAENSLQNKDFRPGGLDDYFRKKRPPNTRSFRGGNTYSTPNSSWGVYDAMHSYSVNDDSSNKPSDWRLPSQCSLTPVDNAIMYSQQNLKQFESSWNVLGVKPPDYSMNQRRSER